MEYKFRGKDIDNGKWIYGSYIKRWNGVCDKHYICNGLYDYSIEEKTVSQYINRKDTNGIEIYVGDIVKVKLSAGYSECYEWKTFIVIFDDKQLSFTLQPIGEVSPWFGVNALKYANEVEVVGNIFDNPEFNYPAAKAVGLREQSLVE